MPEELKKDIKELFELILTLKTQEDCEKFFDDLCTYKELEAMAQRVKAAKMIIKGNTYEQIIKETEISSATLSRVSKCVKYGNGYKNYIK